MWLNGHSSEAENGSTLSVKEKKKLMVNTLITLNRVTEQCCGRNNTMKTRRASDLLREGSPFDFVIGTNSQLVS